MTYQLTKNAVIGTFDNPQSLDIFQIVNQGDGTVLAMDYQGLLHPQIVPTIQKSLMAISTNQNQSVSNVAIATSLYSVSIYAESLGSGAGGTTTVATLSWTNAQGTPKTITLSIPGDSDTIEQVSYVVLAKQGTTITVSTAFSGASFTYDLAIAIAILPTAGGL